MSFEIREPAYVSENRLNWHRPIRRWAESGKRDWTSEPGWGVWRVPESEAQMLPPDMTGMRAIEPGCGTG